MADVSFPQIQFAQHQYPKADYSWLSQIPDNFWKGQAVGRENELRDWIKTNPNAPIDEVARHLMEADPVRGAQLLQSINNQNALNEYRDAQVGVAQANAARAAESPEMRLWREWNESQSGAAEPMRASPPQPSGTPGVSLQNAPAFIQNKFMPVAEQEAQKASGKIQGQNEGMQRARETLAPQLEAAIENMSSSAQQFDRSSFENALGPLQGSNPDDGIVTKELGRAARFGGSVWNAIEGGGTPTYEVRSKILGDTTALALAIKPMVKSPGEGTWTDKDQATLNSIVGDLAEAGTPEEYQRRLGYVVDRLNKTYNLNIKKPTAAVEKNEEQLPAYDAAEPEPPAVQGSVTGPAPQSVQTVPIPAPEMEGHVTTSDPRSGYAKSIKKLDGPAIARIRNWAAEAIAAGVPRNVVMKRLEEIGYGQ
jgi:hypothetical protein